MGERMRVTSHNGRAGTDGAYSAKHNDRNFDLKTADHIDPERSSGNWYWQWDKKAASFDEAEKNFYDKYFADMLQKRNDTYVKNGHRERIQSMDSYRANPKSCPEETILQIGKDGQTVDPKLLQKICIDHINWLIRRYPQARILDAALHVDESGAPHMHIRQVWIGHDKHGNLCVGQAKALKEMGIERPQPDKQENRHNNSKMTYTRECRNHLIDVCRQYGLDIESEPKEASKSGLSLLEYKRSQEMQKLQDLQEEIAQLKDDMAYMDEQLIASQEEHARNLQNASVAQNALESAQRQLLDMAEKMKEIDQINKQLEIARSQLADTLNMKARAAEIRRPFGDKETQTYHKNMLEATRQIGSEAAEKLRAVHSTEQGLIARESAIRAKEKRIKQLQRDAEAKLGETEEKKEHVDDYIAARAAQIAESIIDPEEKDNSREKRMEEFMSRYQIGGKKLYDIFQEEEIERSQKLQERAAKAARDHRHSRKRSDDISL